MARKPKLGAKRQCPSCGTKFYDLGRKPPRCSKCSHEIVFKAATKADASHRKRRADDVAPSPPPPPPARREPRPPTDLSPEQRDALDKAARWLKAGDQQVFRLFGYAGVGKSTLARRLAEGAEGETAYAAFTGKAALVMRSKGCTGASTIHSLIYTAKDGQEAAPTFELNRDGPASKAGLIVIDECSMVDEDLGRDLLSFKKPVLVIGDPAQLPPVKGGGYFTDAVPDAMLTQIHRQAENDPIIRLSETVRGGGRPDYGEYGASRVIRRTDVDAAKVMAADQVLVGMNRTRRQYNARIRELRGLKQPLPVVGDRLVCLRNDRNKGLINGGQWRVDAVRGVKNDFVRLTVSPEDGSGRKAADVAVHKSFFEGAEGELPYIIRRESDEFDYGYALTVHKAQGSQWDDVIVFDESYAFREHAARWLYTAVTRAAKALTLVR